MQLTVSSKATQLLAVSSKAASGEAKRLAVRQSCEAKQQSKEAVISCRLAVAMLLHRCIYPTIKERILATYEWLEEEAKVTVLHTS